MTTTSTSGWRRQDAPSDIGNPVVSTDVLRCTSVGSMRLSDDADEYMPTRVLGVEGQAVADQTRPQHAKINGSFCPTLHHQLCRENPSEGYQGPPRGYMDASRSGIFVRGKQCASYNWAGRTVKMDRVGLERNRVW